MASIKQLAIRGVRSFSPDDAEQVINFSFPCTVIVGANGSGKTTIMECLKFAITGDVPPVNHSSGKTFVHDPQSLPRCTTEALVELHFTDQEGQERIVARPMEARPQKKNHTALSFQQLDGTLLFAVQDGNRVIEEEVVLPCSELNRQVPLLLGVANDSGALIDHVLFCSQDDSLWPLQQTGSVLKERFDAIVGSTRYSKALSALADLQNQYASRARDLKAEQATISIHRQAAMESRDKLSRLESNMEWVEQDIQELQKEELEIKDEEQRLRQKAVKLKGENHRIGWSATVDDDLESLRVRHTAIGSAIARLEGRRSAFVESIRTAKHDLSTHPEYKNVDEEYRIATIELETTELVLKDMRKYHDHLDKALLNFHSLKLAQINKIIHELWMLTYKGEDITRIKIVWGQESESQASPSYNYHVVMSNGSTGLELQGQQCSVGEQVLACLVIRLALAETFCLNFGCIALDEPTKNLDLKNRHGLATALANIIDYFLTKQSNFQLIVMTHDLDFVSMMKRELSSQSRVAMPEQYVLVRREEGTDGKFYSKIDTCEWVELQAPVGAEDLSTSRCA